jgi:hypothetical protein
VRYDNIDLSMMAPQLARDAIDQALQDDALWPGQKIKSARHNPEHLKQSGQDRMPWLSAPRAGERLNLPPANESNLRHRVAAVVASIPKNAASASPKLGPFLF